MSLRINKLLSEAGLGSRREVEQFVIDGRVTLNGDRADVSDVVVEDDVVKLDGEELPVNDLLRESESVRKYMLSLDEDDEYNNRRGRSKSGQSSDLSGRGGKVTPRKMRNERYSDGDDRSSYSKNRGKKQGRSFTPKKKNHK